MSRHATPRREVHVAIVGSGLTGLVATYLLSAHMSHSSDAPSISVEIFERASTLGMDSASISVPLPLAPTSDPSALILLAPPDQHESVLRSRSHKRFRLQAQPLPESAPQIRIDVPMRAFTGGYYPQLLALYRHLGIKTKKTNFTYSFAALPSTASSTKSSSNCNTRPSSPDRRTAAHPNSSPAWTQADTSHNVVTPSPSILYNGANGARGVSLPSHLRNPCLPSPVTISNIVDQISRLRAYFASLLVLVFGYVQLLVVALWHHRLGHTSDPSHPLRARTLRQLVDEPFPTRPHSPSPTLRTMFRTKAERAVESALRRLVRLDATFAQQTLAPLFSAVMTSSLESVWSCPASEVLDYVALTLGKDHFVVKDGVRTVVAALLAHVEKTNAADSQASKVWTGAEVRNVQYRDGRAWLSVIHHSATQNGDEMSRQSSSSSSDRTFCNDETQHGPFDHVIFATQANQTARFLKQYKESIAEQNSVEAERLGAVMEVLGRFKYERSVVVNHTDRTLLPEEKGDWRDLNLVSPHHTPTDIYAQKQGWARRDSDSSDWTDDSTGADERDPLSHPSLNPVKPCDGYTMATHILTLPQEQKEMLVMQTTNPLPTLLPHPTTVLSTSTFERAVIDVPAHIARSLLFNLSTLATASHGPGGVAVKTAGGRSLTLGPLQASLVSGAGGRGGKQDVGVWVCGSWAVGIPLLEGCVVSARVVAEEILRREGGSLPLHARW